VVGTASEAGDIDGVLPFRDGAGAGTVVRQTLMVITCLAGGCHAAGPGPGTSGPAESVREYRALRRLGDIVVDGALDDPGWQSAAWTTTFVDIEGNSRPVPPLRTRVRMTWDERFFYIGADLEEPHLWATITRRDAVIFQDDDFEVFLDPDGDTRRYMELEINALGTVWDLFLPKPYREGGKAVNEWTITGLRAAVRLEGTLNNPRDRDRGWSVELALPWETLSDSGRITVPPRNGDRWRVNFSRVKWDLEVVDGGYRKRTDPATGQPLPEHNWVWSPQGEINMHIPERWGLVTFAERR
jgi:hypothetical protein